MAKAIWGGSIGFGMAHIPVDLKTATREHDIEFKRWHEPTGQRPRQVQMVGDPADEILGEREVPLSEMSRAFELVKPNVKLGELGQYVIVTEEDIQRIAPESSHHMKILKFVPLSTVDPLRVEKTYFLTPQGKGAEFAYTLFCEALHAEGVAGIVKCFMKTKEHLAMIHMNEGFLCLSTLFYEDEIVASNAQYYRIANVEESQVDMARQLIQLTTAETFDPTEYKDEQQERIMALIAAKANDEELPEVPVVAVEPSVDILTLIKAELDGRKVTA